MVVSEVTLPVSLLMRVGECFGFCLQHPSFRIVHPEMRAIAQAIDAEITAAGERLLAAANSNGEAAEYSRTFGVPFAASRPSLPTDESRSNPFISSRPAPPTVEAPPPAGRPHAIDRFYLEDVSDLP